jgi:hypothetical protein
MLIPTADASQWVEATAPKVPRISGRVVKAGMDVLRLIIICSAKLNYARHQQKAFAVANSASAPI